MTDSTQTDDGAEPATESEPLPADEVDQEAVRQLAHALSHGHPESTPEENWLRAEDELRHQIERERRLAEADAQHEKASFMAKIEMDVFGHP